MDDFERYFVKTYAEQLERVGGLDELRELLLDLSWIRGKLTDEGVAGLDEDLSRLDSDPAVRELRAAVRRSAGVLGPLDPPSALNSTILSRLPEGPVRSAVLQSTASSELVPLLVPVWPMPDDVPALGGVANVGSKITELCSFPGRPLLLAGTDGGDLRILTSDSLTRVATLSGHSDAITAAAVSPTGQAVVTADSRGGLILWVTEPDGWLPTTKVDLKIPHDYAVERCAFFDSGRFFATASFDGAVYVWDMATRQPIQRLGGNITDDPNDSPGPMLIDPAERWIMLCLFRHFHPVVTSVWRLPDGLPLHSRNDFVPQALSPSGGVIGNIRDDVVEWDPLSGLAVRMIAQGWLAATSRFPQLRNRVRGVVSGREETSWISAWAVAPDGSGMLRMITKEEDDRRKGTVSTWSRIETLGRSRDWGHRANVSGKLGTVVRGPGAEWVAIGTEVAYNLGEVHLCRPGAADPVRQLGSHRGPVTAGAAGGDGSWFATGDLRGDVRVWPVQADGVGNGALDIAFPAVACRSGPDGTWVALVDSQRTVHVIDTASGRERFSVLSHENVQFLNGLVFTCEITADGRWIVSADDDGAVYVSDARTGTRRWTWPGHGHQIVASATPGRSARTWVATVDAAGLLTVGEPSSGRLVHTESLDLPGAIVCAADPQGRWLAVAADKQAYLLKSGSRWATQRMTGMAAGMSAVTSSADGESVILGDRAGLVTFHPTMNRSRGVARIQLSGGIEHLAVSPAGKWTAAVTDPKAGTLAILGPGQSPAVLTRMDNAITVCRASPDGSGLVTAGWDGTVTVWDPRRGQAITGIRIPQTLSDVGWLPSARHLCVAGVAGGYLLTLV